MVGISLAKSTNESLHFDNSFIESMRSLDDDLEIKVIERSSTVMMIEWAIPAGIALVLLKPFFDKFMGELGAASGKLLIASIARQYVKSQEADERLYSVNDLRQLAELEKAGLPSSDFPKLGRAIAPLEFQVRESLWVHDYWGERYVNYRFVLPAELDAQGVADAIDQLVHQHVQLLDDTPLEFPHLLEGALAGNLDSLPGRIELVFDKDLYRWISSRKKIERHVKSLES